MSFLTPREETGEGTHDQAPQANVPGAFNHAFLSSLLMPYRLHDCICQYDCVHAESLHPHFQALRVQRHMSAPASGSVDRRLQRGVATPTFPLRARDRSVASTIGHQDLRFHSDGGRDARELERHG